MGDRLRCGWGVGAVVEVAVGAAVGAVVSWGPRRAERWCSGRGVGGDPRVGVSLTVGVSVSVAEDSTGLGGFRGRMAFTVGLRRQWFGGCIGVIIGQHGFQ